MSYRAAIVDLARPTPSQVGDFVGYAFRAHSWYKGLALGQPEMRFGFYLDPSAGHARRVRPDRSVELVETRDGDIFTINLGIPTRRYLERFGHLEFVFDMGAHLRPRAAPGSGTGDPSWRDDRAQVFSPEHGVVTVPREVLDVGTVELTAVVHPLTDSTYHWTPAWERLSRWAWPEQSGGRAAIARLGEVVERAITDPNGSFDAALLLQGIPWEGRARHAYDLYEFIAPERERQRREATLAIERMLEHVFAGR